VGLRNVCIVKISTLRSLLSTPWAIHAGAASEMLDRYINHTAIGGEWSGREELALLELRGSNQSISIKPKKDETPLMAFAAAEDMADGDMGLNSDQFIAILHVNGPMMKYGGLCSYGMDEMADLVNGLKANPNVVGLISICDSPGGQIAGTSNFSNAILNFGKPTIAYVNDGFCASANYWYAASHDKIYTSTSTCEIGSIGVMCTITDNSAALEKEGIKKITIYSRLSSAKNQPVEQALEGKPGLMQDNLDAIAKEFHAHVESRRTLTDKKVLDGAMYLSEHAFALGLTDGMKQLDEVMAIIMDMAKTQTAGAIGEENNTTKNLTEMNIQQFDAVKGVASADISAEQVSAITDALRAEGIEGIEVVPAGTVADLKANVILAEADRAELDQLREWKKGTDVNHTQGNDKVDAFKDKANADDDLMAALKAKEAAVLMNDFGIES
jgi:ClpP class serine protease